MVFLNRNKKPLTRGVTQVTTVTYEVDGETFRFREDAEMFLRFQKWVKEGGSRRLDLLSPERGRKCQTEDMVIRGAYYDMVRKASDLGPVYAQMLTELTQTKGNRT